MMYLPWEADHKKDLTRPRYETNFSRRELSKENEVYIYSLDSRVRASAYKKYIYERKSLKREETK